MSQTVDSRLIGRLSIAYVVALISEVMRNSTLDFLDLLIVTTVADANNAAQRGAAAAGHAASAVGISRNAVSRKLHVPLETVRRRASGLVKRGALLDESDGLVFSTENRLGIGGDPELHAVNLRLLRQLFRELKANGVSMD